MATASTVQNSVRIVKKGRNLIITSSNLEKLFDFALKLSDSDHDVEWEQVDEGNRIIIAK
ncbi:MAG TPA: hypothetical protein OIM45_00255 [Clostridiaceae bacterium]|jgi:hypothetical protein|nr:hypothetical protein [Clostridiaceae bacterium]